MELQVSSVVAMMFWTSTSAEVDPTLPAHLAHPAQPAQPAHPAPLNQLLPLRL
jgi:hypothetical protein